MSVVDAFKTLRASAQPKLLVVSHRLGGGVERFIRDQSSWLTGHAIVLRLEPWYSGYVRLFWDGGLDGSELYFRLPASLSDLKSVLLHIGLSRVHYQHALGFPESILTLARDLEVPWDITLHDYFVACPRITLIDRSGQFCELPAVQKCNECLGRTGVLGVREISEWRQRHQPWLKGARRVYTPSLDLARRMNTVFPNIDMTVASLELDPKDLDRPPIPRALGPDGALRVAVIGALSSAKGAEVVADLVRLVGKQKVPIEIHLFGRPYRHLADEGGTLTVHGRYREDELDGLFSSIKPHVAWFPARWPETYSYTLSAAMKARLPIVAPDIGAFAERLCGRAWTWITPWNRSAEDWIVFFSAIIDHHFATGQPPQNAESIPSLELAMKWDLDYLTSLTPGKPDGPLDEIRLARFAVVPLPVRWLIQARRSGLSFGIWARHQPVLARVVKWVPLSVQLTLRRMIAGER